MTYPLAWASLLPSLHDVTSPWSVAVDRLPGWLLGGGGSGGGGGPVVRISPEAVAAASSELASVERAERSSSVHGGAHGPGRPRAQTAALPDATPRRHSPIESENGKLSAAGSWCRRRLGGWKDDRCITGIVTCPVRLSGRRGGGGGETGRRRTFMSEMLDGLTRHLCDHFAKHFVIICEHVRNV